MIPFRGRGAPFCAAPRLISLIESQTTPKSKSPTTSPVLTLKHSPTEAQPAFSPPPASIEGRPKMTTNPTRIPPTTPSPPPASASPPPPPATPTSAPPTSASSTSSTPASAAASSSSASRTPTAPASSPPPSRRSSTPSTGSASPGTKAPTSADPTAPTASPNAPTSTSEYVQKLLNNGTAYRSLSKHLTN